MENKLGFWGSLIISVHYSVDKLTVLNVFFGLFWLVLAGYYLYKDIK